MTVIGEAFVDVKARTDGFEESATSGLTSSLKKVVGVVGAAVATEKLIDFGKGAFDAAIESQKIAAQTEAVIKSTGAAAGISAKQIGDLANAISKKTGVDDEAIQTGENLLLTFTNVQNKAGQGNDVFDQATKIMVDMSKALGTDASGSAIQLGKALNDPIKGVTALTRVGVTFSDEQKELIKSLVSTGDTLGAQKIILGELNKEFGGSAEAQATATDKMKVAWGNLQEQIGAKLIPAVEAVSTWVVEKGIPGLQHLASTVQEALQPAFAKISEWMPAIVDTLKTFAGILLDLLIPAVKRWADLLVFEFQTIWEVAGPIFEKLGAIIESAAAIFDEFGFNVQSVGFVIADAFASLLEVFGVSEETASAWGEKLRGIFLAVVDVVQQVFDTIGAIIDHTTAIFDQFGFSVGTVGLAIRDAIITILEQFGVSEETAISWATNVEEAFFSVVDFVTQAASDIVAVLEVMWTVLSTAAEIGLAAIQALWRTFGDEILLVVESVFTFIVDAIQAAMTIIEGVINIVMGLITGDWQRAWEGLLTVLTGIWDAIHAVIELALGLMEAAISASMTIIAGIFDEGWQLIKDGLQAAWDLILAAVQLAFDGMIAIIKGAWDLIIAVITGAIQLMLDAVRLAFEGMVTVVKGAWDAINAAIQTAINTAIGLIQALPGQIIALGGLFLDAGISIIERFADGLKNIAGKLADLVSEISGFLASLPGRVAGVATDAGFYIAAAIGEGFRFIADRLPILASEIITFLAGLPGRVYSYAIEIGTTIVNAIVSGVGDVGGAIWDKISGGISAIPGKIGGILGSIIPGARGGNFDLSLPSYAYGGTHRGQGIALVGERGPELVQFGGTTAVFPTNELEMSMAKALATVAPAFFPGQQFYKALAGWDGGGSSEPAQSFTINVMIESVGAGNANDVGRRVAVRTAQVLQTMGIGVGARQAANR